MKELILDTETTGLAENSEIIEICIIDIEGNILLDTLLKPKISIPKKTSEIHGIYDEHVKDAPTWEQIYPHLLEIIGSNKVYIYNAQFDVSMLNRTSRIYQLKGFRPVSEKADFSKLNQNKNLIKSSCVMNTYAKIWKQEHHYFDEYVWQSLSDAAKQQSIDMTDLTMHRALGDCELTRRLLLKIKNNQCSENPINENARRAEEAKAKKSEANERYRAKINKIKMKLVPVNALEYKDFGQVDRPSGYKTFSQLKVKDLDSYEFAGMCCNTYGRYGYLFRPIV